MVKNIIKFSVSEALVKLVPIITTFLLAKTTSLEELGIISILLVLLEIGFIFVSNNIQATTRIEYFKDNRDLLIDKLRVKIRYSSAVYFFLAIPCLISIFYIDIPIYIVVLIPICRTVSALALSLSQCEKRINAYFSIQLLFVLVFVSVFYLYNSFNLLGWAYSLSIAYLFQAILAIYVLISFGLFANNPLTQRTVKWSDVVFGFSFMPQAFGWWVKNAFERYIVQLQFGMITLGLYSYAYQYSSILTFSVTAINLALVPEINKLLQLKSKLAFRKLNNIYIIFSIFLFIMSLFTYVISIFITNNYYQELAESKDMIIYGILAVLTQSIAMLMMNELYFCKNERFVAYLVLFLFSAQSLVTYVFSYNFSIEVILMNSVFFNAIMLIFICLRIFKIRREVLCL
ncbi:hypothetical protein AB6C74_14335 [Vibrio splendidus]